MRYLYWTYVFVATVVFLILVCAMFSLRKGFEGLAWLCERSQAIAELLFEKWVDI